MLKLLDIVFLCLHLLIILFNLFAWIWIRTRKLHLIVLAATLFSWFILGLKYGLGYCFLTDWHWEVKRSLGATDLPASFIKYFFDQYTPFHFSAALVDVMTAISIIIVIILTIYFNFMKKRKSLK